MFVPGIGTRTQDKPAYVFSPDDEIWRVNRHANGLLFGPAAVLLQIAHPRVAQGVADHSDFQHDALGRLKRTLTTVNRIAFGTVAEGHGLCADGRAEKDQGEEGQVELHRVSIGGWWLR